MSRYGTEAEKYLRGLFALDFPEYQVLYDENNMFLNPDFPWMHASLLTGTDGQAGAAWNPGDQDNEHLTKLPEEKLGGQDPGQLLLPGASTIWQ